MNRRSRRGADGEDDGRVLVNMQVEGMPGYTGNSRAEQSNPPLEPLTKRETRQLIAAGIKWALLGSAGFALLLVLLILFCTRVWFA